MIEKDVRPWLPVGDGARRRFTAAIESALAAWAADWFCSSETIVRGRSHITSNDGEHWRSAAGYVLALPDDNIIRFSRLAGVMASSDTPTAIDLTVLASLRDAMVQDLDVRISAAFDLPLPAALPTKQAAISPGGDETSLFATLATETVDVLHLGVPQELLAKFCRGPKTKRQLRPLVSRRTALGASQVAIQASFGTAAIAIADVRTLQRGDVIRLDRRHQDGVDIRVAGAGAVARAALAEVDGGLALTFVGAIS